VVYGTTSHRFRLSEKSEEEERINCRKNCLALLNPAQAETIIKSVIGTNNYLAARNQEDAVVYVQVRCVSLLDR
jgi:hypothetical protein